MTVLAQFLCSHTSLLSSYIFNFYNWFWGFSHRITSWPGYLSSLLWLNRKGNLGSDTSELHGFGGVIFLLGISVFHLQSGAKHLICRVVMRLNEINDCCCHYWFTGCSQDYSQWEKSEPQDKLPYNHPQFYPEWPSWVVDKLQKDRDMSALFMYPQWQAKGMVNDMCWKD